MARQKQQPEDSNALSLKSLTKSSVWDVQENDIFRMLEAGLKDADIKENFRHYIDLIRCAFEIVEIPEHRWFIGTQFHPEYSSTVLHPHPLFMNFIKEIAK